MDFMQILRSCSVPAEHQKEVVSTGLLQMQRGFALQEPAAGGMQSPTGPPHGMQNWRCKIIKGHVAPVSAAPGCRLVLQILKADWLAVASGQGSWGWTAEPGVRSRMKPVCSCQHRTWLPAGP